MANTLLAHARFRYVFIGGWLLWSLLHALMVHNFSGSWGVAISDSIASNLLLLGCGLLLMNMLRFYVPQKERYVMLPVWVLVLALCWLVFCRLILGFIIPAPLFQAFVLPTLFVRFCIAFLVIGNLALVSVVWYNWQEQQLLQDRRNEAGKLAKEAELYKLRQQLQPHFLFNSLNSINALIGSQPVQARTMVLQLSEFLRGTLRKEEQQWISLQEELEYLHLYLEIEKVRFGHRLSTHFDIDAGAKNLQLPALLLQPVVENAIKFGLYDTIDDITIQIQARETKQGLVISVQNPFDPETNLPSGTGFGLHSIARRLHLLYGRNDLLHTSAQDHLFTATLTVPQNSRAQA